MEVSEVSTAELAGMGAPYNPRTIADHDLEAIHVVSPISPQGARVQ